MKLSKRTSWSHHNNGGRSLDPNSQIDWSAWNARWILVAWSHLEPATEKKDRPFQVVEFMASTGPDDPNTIRNMAVCPYSNSAQWHTCPVKHIWSPVPGLSQQAKATRWISTQLYYTTRFCRNLQVIDLWRRWFVEVGHSGHTLRDWKQEIRNWWYFNWCCFRKNRWNLKLKMDQQDFCHTLSFCKTFRADGLPFFSGW